MNVKRKVPMRKCVATNQMFPKKELVRIVRSKEGEVQIDLTGKKAGRGAYVSLNEEAILLAAKKNTLASHLEANVDASIYQDLLDLVKKGTI